MGDFAMRKQLIKLAGASLCGVAFLVALLGLCQAQAASSPGAMFPQSTHPGPSAGLLGPDWGGLIYQDFEGPNRGWDGTCSSARPSTAGEPVHSGDTSWRIAGTCTGNTTFVRYKNDAGAWHTDLLRENNDRLVFWIYALPEGAGAGTDNTASVTFYDQGAYHTTGFEAWTTYKAHYDQWTKLTILFDQLPADLNLRDIDKLEFKNYWPGTYYLDDVQAVREDRAYQAFEPVRRSLPLTDTEEFGWCWGAVTDTCRLSVAGEPVHEGEHSWKFQLDSYWGGTGVKSEQEYLAPRTAAGTQSFWDVDLDPEHNDRLQFWVYAMPLNGLDNNVNVQFFDQGAHHTVPVAYWTNQTATAGQWTLFTVVFSDVLALAPDLNLDDIDKIQFQMFWPGTYYLDDIRATSSVPGWDSLRDGVLAWSSDVPLNRYVLQENTTDALSETGWLTVSAGTEFTYTLPHLTRAWYRVRAEEVQDANHEVPFVSDWSPVLEYNPPLVVIDKSRLDRESKLAWTRPSQAITYEVQSAPAPGGPWGAYYSGTYPTSPLAAAAATWYRVRATNGAETSAWSPPQRKPASIEQDFVRAVGTALRAENGTGDSVTLRGVNLGTYFIIEPWMNSWDAANPSLEDDYSIRQELSERFPITGTSLLTQTYRDAFLTEADFDLMQRMGLNLVRVPIYYLDFQDEAGSLLPDRFDRLDWIVDTCADRGMVVLLDLHGAPGSQSVEAHTGRKGYNLLFTATPTGTLFQDQTVALWQDIAAHYKDNPAVVGFDLLNEPTGAASITQLWSFYDRLYDAIRAIDAHHIIMMEGTWDWDTLPPPSDYGWENVVYQFHYYYACDSSQGKCPPDRAYADFVQDHKDFIDGKITMAGGCRYFQCQVPVMIGEFNAFYAREAWDYYLARFNEQRWSWALWSFKFSGPSPWGLLTGQNQLLSDRPIFGEDAYAVLQTKLSEPFDSPTHYAVNRSLVDMVQAYATEPYSPSTTAGITQAVTSTQPVKPGDELTYTLVISAAPGTPVALYDRLVGGTFRRFVTQPDGISHANGLITGTMTVTPSNQVTVTFVVLVVGTTVITNHACLYLLSPPDGNCFCSSEAMAFLAHAIYLPLVRRDRM
jgi:hypothetical protein